VNQQAIIISLDFLDAIFSLIEIGEVLKDFPLFNLDIVSFDLSIGTRLREKDCIKENQGI